MVVDGRRQTNPVGQCGRRPDVRRGRCRSARREILRTGRSAPPADRAARKPAAGQRRHPAGATAGLWRDARRACDLRLRAVRFSRRQSRRPDRGRQHRADRAAAGAASAAPSLRSETPLQAASSEPAPPPSAHTVEQANATPAYADDEVSAPSDEAPAGFALFDAFDDPSATEEVPELNLESVLETNLPHVEVTPRQVPPAEETTPMEMHPDDSSPAFEPADTPLPDAPTVPLRFTWRMDRDGRFTPHAGDFTRLVGPPPVGVRPAVERDRRDPGPRSRGPRDARRSRRARPGAASR